MDEEPLASLQTAAHEDIGPDGEEGLAERRRFGHCHALRHGQRVILMGERVFRVTTAGQKRGNRIALLPARHAGADLGHHARGLKTRVRSEAPGGGA